MQQMMVNNLGQIKIVKDGFSWTTLFFGPFVPLLRGDLKWFLISIICWMFTLGIYQLVFCFLYNKIYINELLNKGYKFENNNKINLIQHNKINIPSNPEVK